MDLQHAHVRLGSLISSLSLSPPTFAPITIVQSWSRIHHRRVMPGLPHSAIELKQLPQSSTYFNSQIIEKLSP